MTNKFSLDEEPDSCCCNLIKFFKVYDTKAYFIDFFDMNLGISIHEIIKKQNYMLDNRMVFLVNQGSLVTYTHRINAMV